MLSFCQDSFLKKRREIRISDAQTKNFLDKIYEGSAKGLVSNLIMGDLLADEEYEELKRLLEKGKGQQ